MNDLFLSGSFGGGYTDLNRQAHIDDLEAGDLDKFFDDVEDVKQDLAELDGLHHRLRDLNEEAKVACDATAVKSLRSRIDKDVALVLRRAKAVKGKLEALDRSNAEQRRKAGRGPGTSSDRTRTSVVAGLGKKLKHLIDDFQSLRTKISAEYKETVERRYYTVTGRHPDEQTIEELISSGESESFVQTAILHETGKGRTADTVSEIQERHGAAMDLERCLVELHQVFTDMAVLVDAQGQHLDDIESHVAHASSFVWSGAQPLESANKLQRSSRKWMCIAVAVVLLVVVTVLVPVVVYLANKHN